MDKVAEGINVVVDIIDQDGDTDNCTIELRGNIAQSIGNFINNLQTK